MLVGSYFVVGGSLVFVGVALASMYATSLPGIPSCNSTHRSVVRTGVWRKQALLAEIKLLVRG